MGKSSSYNHTLYKSTVTASVNAGRASDLFTHDNDIRRGVKPLAVHEMMDPARVNKAGRRVREAFDSDNYPESLPIAVILDITASMQKTPTQMIAGLGKLMRLLIQKGFVPYPQILFSAFGDYITDQVPIQIGQFEADNTIESSLQHIVRQSSGGANKHENSELAIWFLATHSDLDSLKKRGKKGKCFIISDETPYDRVDPILIDKYVGEQIEGCSLEDALAQLRDSYEVWWVAPLNTQYENDQKIIARMQGLFGENYLRLPDANHVAELIAATIAISEGFDPDAVYAGLQDVGADATALASASKALAVYSTKAGAVATKAKVEGTLPATTADASVERL